MKSSYRAASHSTSSEGWCPTPIRVFVTWAPETMRWSDEPSVWSKAQGGAFALPDVVVAGHLCVDLIPCFSAEPVSVPGELREVGPLRVQPGGCVAIVGLALAQLGSEVALVADARADHLGRLLVSLPAAERADASRVLLASDATTSYSVVMQGPASDRAFWHHSGANARFDGSRIDAGGARALRLGYPALLPSLCGAVGDRRAGPVPQGAPACGHHVPRPLHRRSQHRRRISDWLAWFGHVLPKTDLFRRSLDDLSSALGTPHATLRRSRWKGWPRSGLIS
jgi:hypothetical protein